MNTHHHSRTSGSSAESELAELDFSHIDEDLARFQQDALVKEALERNVNLSEYSTNISIELAATEEACIADYMQHSNELATLHTQMQVCDGILERMESMVGRFQNDLGTISEQIKTLQQDSLSMNVKLRNRTELESKLSNFVEKLYVDEEFIEAISTSPVTLAYEDTLAILSDKLAYLDDPYVMASKAAKEVMPILGKLRLKAVQRIREYLLTKFHTLKKPKTNVQIKQKVLLKSRFSYAFLLNHKQIRDGLEGSNALTGSVAEELRLEYVTMMSKLFHAKLSKYLTNIRNLVKTSGVQNKYDLLGVDRKDTGGLFTAKRSEDSLVNMFSLGRRADVLDIQEADILIYHIENKKNTKLNYERIFASEQRLLLETATSEFEFLGEFFGNNTTNYNTDTDTDTDTDHKDGHNNNNNNNDTNDTNGALVRSMFKQVFQKTLDAFELQYDVYLETCYDCISLLLMIRILNAHSKMVTRDRMPCLDSFYDSLNIKLWTRFKVVLDMHLASVSTLQGTKKNDNLPHYVCVRFARLVGAVLALNKGYSDNILVDNVRRLRLEVDKVMVKCAFTKPVQRLRVVTLINSYQLVLHVLSRKVPPENLEWIYFDQQSSAQVALFVEDVLSEAFGRLIVFVQATEAKLHNNTDEPASVIDAKVVGSIARNFKDVWKTGIEQVAGTVKTHFSFKSIYFTAEHQVTAQGEILKQVLVQLMLYYERFQDLIKKLHNGHVGAFQRELVPTQTIMFEIKKFSNRR